MVHDPRSARLRALADATAAKAAVLAVGGAMITPAGRYGTEVIATFHDPAGNLMGIYQQPGLKESES